ncbi:hypothetical protein EH165_03815 [Nakamurella antarctica]|uniref:Uncharacterized protein n=1 Tax=Nakamurella antarctica TaxID=1902245 RepID=A0A3G8ZTP8_9ACTN|nr:hypothetical protein [Nakamurella antarctica]AZI57416.1 hypothetical protein EH165_03815 [Nakamurella antarctica]
MSGDRNETSGVVTPEITASTACGLSTLEVSTGHMRPSGKRQPESGTSCRSPKTAAADIMVSFAEGECPVGALVARPVGA